jgi:sensor histidine kinase YesM
MVMNLKFSKKHFIIILIVLCSQLKGYAADTLRVSDMYAGNISLKNIAQLQKFHNASNNSDSQIIQFNNQAFKQLPAHYAITISIQNNTHFDTTIYLDKSISENNYVQLFSNNVCIDSFYTGLYVPANKNHNPRYKNVMPIFVKKQSYIFCKILLDNYVASNKPNTLTAALIHNKDVNKFDYFIKTIFLGITFFIFVFYITLFTISRLKIFKYYALFALFLFFHESYNLAYIYNVFYFIDNYPLLQQAIAIPIQYLTITMYCYFIFELLQAKIIFGKYFIVLKYWLRYLILNSIFIFIVYLATKNYEIQYYTYTLSRFIIYIGIIILFLIFSFLVKGTIKYYFVIAVGILIVSGTVGMFVNDFNYTSNSFTSTDLPILSRIGFIIEFIFYGFVLGLTIQKTQNEKEENQEALINQLSINRNLIEENNLILEKKIAQRTKEIEEKTQALLSLRYDKKIIDSELFALRSQMNPHFIFNSLNSINSFIVNNNTEAASAYLNDFSKLIRLIFENSKHSFISLEQEIFTINYYIKLEALRFKDKFKYEIIVAENVPIALAKIPPMLLQPHIENAIWHGLMHKLNGIGSLVITFDYLNDKTIKIEIKDNGIGRKKSIENKKLNQTHENSFGVLITQQRIDLLQQDIKNNISIQIEDLYQNNIAFGTSVILKFDLHNN